MAFDELIKTGTIQISAIASNSPGEYEQQQQKKPEIKLQQLFGQQVGGSNFFMAKFLQLMQMITRVQSLNKFMAVIL